MKIRRWFIYIGFFPDNSCYILDLTGENINDDEIALCIEEQVYDKEFWKKAHSQFNGGTNK